LIGNVQVKYLGRFQP